jgi:adenylate cyclase
MSPAGARVLKFGPFRIDHHTGSLTRDGTAVAVGGRALDILVALADANGAPVPKNTLLDRVWPGITVGDNNLQVQVSLLRRTLGDGWIITVPGHGYRLAIPAEDADPADDGIDPAVPGSVQSDKPSVAVLPFVNLSGSLEQEYFSDGLAEDVILALSRSRSLFVIARNSSFTYKGRAVEVRQVARELGVRYVLEGSLRRSAERVRVNAQLIDASTGKHIWAERYDRAVEDVFAVQDAITASIVKAIGPAIDSAEQQRALRRHPSSLGAWEAYQRGSWHLFRRKPEDVPKARHFFERALELDPALAVAHIGLALLITREGDFFGTRPLLESMALAADEVRKAVLLDPTDAEAHAHLASALGGTGDLSGAIEVADRALAMNENCATAYHVRGWALIFSGRPREGREVVRFAMRLDPRTAWNMALTIGIPISHYFEKDYEQCVASAQRLVADRPDHPWAYRWLAAALGQLGRTCEARDALAKAQSVSPDVFDTFVRQRVPWMRPDDYEHMLDGLRKAGWLGTS